MRGGEKMRILKKIVYKIKTSKIVVAVTGAVSSIAVGSLAHADTAMASTLTTSVQTAVTDTISYMSALLPIGLTVFAVTWGVKKAIRFFKGASN
jgi:putative effector of murein hydrolase